MWFQYEGTLFHYGLCVHQHLTTAFGQRWTGRRELAVYLLTFLDLSSLNFFLSGLLKSVVYETHVNSQCNGSGCKNPLRCCCY